MIGCRWVYKVKHSSNGKIERFKSQLVAKDYSQTCGIDYEKTFSPVVRFSSIRVLIAYAVQNNMIIHQMDVVTAFLNGKLEDDIYMEQPEGYIVAGKEQLVCKLKRSLYGLKQSSRCWNATLKEYLESQGYKQSNADPCVFSFIGDNGVTLVAVYVYDLLRQ